MDTCSIKLQCHQNPVADTTDAERLYSDWKCVGEDISHAMDKVIDEQKK